MPTPSSWLMLAFTVCANAAPSTAQAQDTKPVDLTGKWAFSVTTDAGTGTPTVTLQQRGDTLTGHYSSEILGEAELRGTVSGRTITFTVTVEMQGTSFAVTYTGTVEGTGTLKGTVDLAGMSTGTFTARRV